jgi:integrase
MSTRGSIYFRESDKRWVGQLQMPKDPLTGKKQKPKYVYSSLPGRKGRQEVERKLQELIDKIDAGNLSDIYKIKVKGWLEKFLKVYCKEKKLAQTTIEEYERYIKNHINPEIGDLFLHEVKPIHIQNFYNKERNADRGFDKNGNKIIGFSESTILQEHRILHRAFDKAVADGFMERNPCDGVDAPSPDEYEPTIYTEEEFALLLDKLKGHRMEAIILLAGMCGLRRGELLALTWEDIDLKKGIIRITKNTVPTTKEGIITKSPKTKKSIREIAIPSIIIPELKRLRGIGKIYTRLDGKDYNPGSVSRAFKDFLEKNGLRHIRLHDLRHFNATMMLKNDISDKEAMERLGHSNQTMLHRYQHMLEEMDRESADKLNNVLKKKIK